MEKRPDAAVDDGVPVNTASARWGEMAFAPLPRSSPVIRFAPPPSSTSPRRRLRGATPRTRRAPWCDTGRHDANLRLADHDPVPGLDDARDARDGILGVTVHAQRPAARLLQLQVPPRVIVVFMRRQNRRQAQRQTSRHLPDGVRIRGVDRRRLARGVIDEEVAVVIVEKRHGEDRTRREGRRSNAARVRGAARRARRPNHSKVEPTTDETRVDEVADVEGSFEHGFEDGRRGDGVQGVDGGGRAEAGGGERRRENRAIMRNQTTNGDVSYSAWI